MKSRQDLSFTGGGRPKNQLLKVIADSTSNAGSRLKNFIALNFPHRRKSALTLGEILISIAVVGLLMVILIPIMRNMKPDENDAMHKKATFIVERIINELSTDEYLYPKSGEFSGLSNTSSVALNGQTHGGSTKFCTLFASRINKKPGTEVNCAHDQLSVTSIEGIDWYLPISDFQNGPETLTIDVNGNALPNTLGKDRFEYKIQPGQKIPVVEIPNLAPTVAPPARPGIGDPPTPADETKTGLESYSISCNAPGASVFGNGANKVNGNYTLVAIPRKGYKCSWFTKQVTVKDADVTNCDLSCTPDTLRPQADGETIIPPPEPEPEPEKTYCINVTMTGEQGKCTVTGDGCGKPNGIYEVSITSKDEDNYKPVWTQGKPPVTISNADVNLTAECGKVDKSSVTATISSNCETFVLDYLKNPISQSYKSDKVSKTYSYNSLVQLFKVEDVVGSNFTLSTADSAKFCPADQYDAAAGCKATPQSCTFKSWRANGTDVSAKTSMQGKVGDKSSFTAFYECGTCTQAGNYTITVTDNIKRTYKSAYYYEDYSDVTIETDHKELSGLNYNYKTEKMMFKGGASQGERHGTSNVNVNQGAATNYWVLTHSDCAPSTSNCTPYEDRLVSASENRYNTTNYKIKIGSTVIYDSSEKENNKEVSHQSNKYKVVFVENFTDGQKPSATDTISIGINSPLTIKGAPGYDDAPSVSVNGDNVYFIAKTDVTISSFVVVPSNKTKPWVLRPDDGDWQGYASVSSGTGEKNFNVTLSTHRGNETCLTARYTDNSGTSDKICFKRKEGDPHTKGAGLRIDYDASSYKDMDVDIKLSPAGGGAPTTLTYNIYGTTTKGTKQVSADPGIYTTSITKAKVRKTYSGALIDVKAIATISPAQVTIPDGGVGQVDVKIPPQEMKEYKITMYWKDDSGKTDATATYCGANGTYTNPDGSTGNFTDNPVNGQKATIKEGGSMKYTQESSCTVTLSGGGSLKCTPAGISLEGSKLSGNASSGYTKTISGYGSTNLTGNVHWNCSSASQCPNPANATVRLQPQGSSSSTGWHLSGSLTLDKALPVATSVIINAKMDSSSCTGTFNIPANSKGPIVVTFPTSCDTSSSPTNVSGSKSSVSPSECITNVNVTTSGTGQNTMDVTVNLSSDSKTSAGEFYIFTIVGSGILNYGIEMSGNYHSVSPESNDPYSTSGMRLNFLYQGKRGDKNVFLEDFYCRLKIGSELLYCDYSGTTTIDGVIVTVKNSNSGVGDTGRRKKYW